MVTTASKGPFAEPLNDAGNIDDDVAQQSLSTKFPGVTMISPNVAGEDRARSLIAKDGQRAAGETQKVVSDPDQNPHLAPASETYRQANSNPGHSIQR